MIRYRATSNMSDGEDRTCQAWLSLGAVARNVLFTTEPRLLRPGFAMGSEYVYIPRREAPESHRIMTIDAEILPSGLRASPLVLDFPARQPLNI
jgi:hypothetical protein